MKNNNLLKNVNRKRLTSNTQKVAFRLLNAGGSWVSRKELERSVASATARVRDLRKDEYGGFEVECASATDLNRTGSKGVFFYRIKPSSVKKTQVSTVFRI